MKKLLLAWAALLLGLLPAITRADGFINDLDAQVITYDGVVVSTAAATDENTRDTVTFKVNKTGEIITLKVMDGWYSTLTVKGPSDDPFENLQPGMRVLVKRYKGSKGARYAKRENGKRPKGVNDDDFDDYVYQLKATSKPQPK